MKHFPEIAEMIELTKQSQIKNQKRKDNVIKTLLPHARKFAAKQIRKEAKAGRNSTYLELPIYLGWFNVIEIMSEIKSSIEDVLIEELRNEGYGVCRYCSGFPPLIQW